MQKLQNSKRGIIAATVALSVGLILLLSMLAPHAFASGDAYFSLSPSSGTYTVGSSVTLTVSETALASDQVEGVQANLSYPASLLQFTSASESGSPFTICVPSTGGGGTVQIACASTSPVSGTNTIAQINFTVLAANRATVAIASGSDIQNSSTTSVFNGVDPSVSYTLQTPVTSPPSGGGSSSGGSSGGGSSSSNSSTGSSSSTKSTATGTKSTTPATTTPSTSTPAPTSAPAPITPAPIDAQTTPAVQGTISVTVIDNQGKTVQGASVTINNMTHTTNAVGVAVFADLTPGNHTIAVTDKGKKTTGTSVTLTPGQNKLVTLQLNNTAGSVTTASIIIVIVLVLVVAGGGYWFFSFRRRNYLPPSHHDHQDHTAADVGNTPMHATASTLTPGQTVTPAGTATAQEQSAASAVPGALITPSRSTPKTTSSASAASTHKPA